MWPNFSVDKNGTGSGAMLSYSLRKDGWVYLESSGGIGIVGTRIFWLSHGEIAVNLNAATGRVRCRATDQHNKPLVGYDWNDSVPCEACNTLAWIPQWSNQRNLSSLAGQGSHSVIRLEFEMVNARLVSAETPQPIQCLDAPYDDKCWSDWCGVRACASASSRWRGTLCRSLRPKQTVRFHQFRGQVSSQAGGHRG
jgi:hypothetical protein